MGEHSDSGRPMPDEVLVGPRIKYHKFPSHTRQVSIRNTGVSTLWISFDRKHWFDVACGTSWDDRVNVAGFWHCTQTGKTYFAVNGIQIAKTGENAPAPTDDELTT